MWFGYLLLLILGFYLTNLLPPGWRWQVDFFSLILIFLTIQGRILTATFLALFTGLLLDAYGPGPLGLEASRLLLAVSGIRLLRLWLNLHYPLPQVLAVMLLVSAQGMLTLGWLSLLLPQELAPALDSGIWVPALVTGLAAPVVLALLGYLDRKWQRFFLLRQGS